MGTPCSAFISILLLLEWGTWMNMMCLTSWMGQPFLATFHEKAWFVSWWVSVCDVCATSPQCGLIPFLFKLSREPVGFSFEYFKLIPSDFLLWILEITSNSVQPISVVIWLFYIFVAFCDICDICDNALRNTEAVRDIAGTFWAMAKCPDSNGSNANVSTGTSSDPLGGSSHICTKLSRTLRVLWVLLTVRFCSDPSYISSSVGPTTPPVNPVPAADVSSSREGQTETGCFTCCLNSLNMVLKKCLTLPAEAWKWQPTPDGFDQLPSAEFVWWFANSSRRTQSWGSQGCSLLTRKYMCKMCNGCTKGKFMRLFNQRWNAYVFVAYFEQHAAQARNKGTASG